MVHYCSQCNSVQIIPNISTKLWNCDICKNKDETRDIILITTVDNELSNKQNVYDKGIKYITKDPVTAKINEKCPNCSIPFMSYTFLFGKYSLGCSCGYIAD